MTLEQQIDQVSEAISGMEERTHHPDEWAKINDMHLTICELKGQLKELRDIEKRNLNLKGETK
jgi:hypothetical protein